MTGKYKMVKRKIHGKDEEDGHDDGEKFCLKRKKVFLGEFGREVYMCYYLDPDKRICTIYPDRPDVCRDKKVSCQNSDYLRRTVNSQWLKLKNGTAACLSS